MAHLFSLESLLHRFSQLPELATTAPSPVLCAHLVPVLRTAMWMLAPASYSEISRALVSHLACWRQAVAPLPPAGQSALLAADQFQTGFGSAQAVTEALARAPQVAVVYRGQSSSRPSAARGRSSITTHRPSSSRHPPATRQPRTDVRYQPYPARPSRPSTSSGDRCGRQA